jgi:hypothetical protein
MEGSAVVGAWLEPNDAMRTRLQTWGHDDRAVLVVEQIESFGMPVGVEVFETVFWAGRFVEVWGGAWERVTRRAVKLHLCGQARAKDGHIRQALIDRYGPGREAAIGRKASPGPLHGLRADLWAALAVGVTWTDTHAA